MLIYSSVVFTCQASWLLVAFLALILRVILRVVVAGVFFVFALLLSRILLVLAGLVEFSEAGSATSTLIVETDR